MGKKGKGLGHHKGNAHNRDYDREYSGKDVKYRQGDPKNIADRSSRNQARAQQEKNLGRSLGERGTAKEEHAHHKDGNPQNNSEDNVETVSAKKNLQEGDPSDPSGLVGLRNSVARRYGRG